MNYATSRVCRVADTLSVEDRVDLSWWAIQEVAREVASGDIQENEIEDALRKFIRRRIDTNRLTFEAGAKTGGQR